MGGASVCETVIFRYAAAALRVCLIIDAGSAGVSPATPEARMGHCPIVKQTLFASAGAFKEYRFSI